jgi:signal transduction histidine kinase
METIRRPIIGKDGKAEGLLSIGMDITAHKRIQNELREQGEITASLARVGEEIITALHQPDLLERLCRLAVESMKGDFAQIWTWHRDEGDYTPVAQYNFPQQSWEGAQVLRVPRSAVLELADRAERLDISWLAREAVIRQIPAPMLQAVPELASIAVIPLHRGGQLTAVMTLGFAQQSWPLSGLQERVARGLSHLGSLALENASLLEQLERANQLELRTPLNVILGYVGLMLDGELGALDEGQLDTLRRVRSNAAQLLDLINTTLDVSRLDAGHIPINVSTTSIEEFVHRVDSHLRDALRNPEVDFRWRLGSADQLLTTDIAKLTVVTQNLVRNALKFTERGEISTSIRADHDRISITVADTGIGIPPQAHETIFHPFEQGDTSIGTRYGGVGLGLYIVRRLVEALGGSLELESEVGKGSTFRVSIPQRGAPS